MPVVDQSRVHVAPPSRFGQPTLMVVHRPDPATEYSNDRLYAATRSAFCRLARRGTVPRSMSPGSVSATPKALLTFTRTRADVVE